MIVHLDGNPYVSEPVRPYEFRYIAPSFPHEAFPPTVGRAIADVCRVDQAPVEIVAMGALAVMSIVLQSRIDVMRPNRPPSPVSLNLLNVSQSGDGKTVVEENFFSVISELERRASNKNENNLRSRERDLAFYKIRRKDLEHRIANATKLGLSPNELKLEWDELLDAIDALSHEESAQQQHIYSNASFEGLRRALEGKGRAAGVVSFDGGGILNGMLTTNSTQLNNFWDGKGLAIQHASATSRIFDPRVSMFLAVQESELGAFLKKDRGHRALGNGFLARFLFAESSPVIVQISKDSKPGAEEFKKKLVKILETPRAAARTNIGMSGEAAEYWETYFNTLRRAEAEVDWVAEIGPFVRKLPEQAARIAALFQHFENFGIVYPLWCREVIDLSTMRKAIQLCDWFMHTYRVRFTDNGEARKKKVQTIADKILAKLESKFDEKLRMRQFGHPPRVHRYGEISDVSAGDLFSWQTGRNILAYTKKQLQNRVYQCDYDLLDEALDHLASQGALYLAPGPRQGKVILYVGRPYLPWNGGQDWRMLLPRLPTYFPPV
ncbi:MULTISPECIES: DUF3987 domain-containing protein [Pandoraea]|uniref:DUF3987 domain-containing protein n=1 Tax=Pandoraea TaxID=93217 RepID=UPI0025A51F0F|nr:MULTISPECIES: DUF3987 domain-containing protein [Pandoraea]MDM8359636.1 DUF3987 domain-containing protein [Pandoraea communis]